MAFRHCIPGVGLVRDAPSTTIRWQAHKIMTGTIQVGSTQLTKTAQLFGNGLCGVCQEEGLHPNLTAGDQEKTKKLVESFEIQTVQKKRNRNHGHNRKEILLIITLT